jgi:hypothetical protein
MAYRHSFEPINNFSKVMSELRPGNAIFTAMLWANVPTGHVVLLAKGLDNVSYVLDAQIPSLFPNAQSIGGFLYTFENYPLQTPTSIGVICTDLEVESSERMDIG